MADLLNRKHHTFLLHLRTFCQKKKNKSRYHWDNALHVLQNGGFLVLRVLFGGFVKYPV